MEWVIWLQVCEHALHDMRDEIDSNKIHQSEDSRLGQANRTAEHGICLLDAEAMIQRSHNSSLNEIHTESVADESRRVITHRHPLPKAHVGEFSEAVQHIIVDLWTCYDFEQGEIARWVEEVGDEESTCDVVRHSVSQGRARQC